MKIWVDAQLPPRLARSLRDGLGLESEHVADLGLAAAEDEAIFAAARHADAIVVTKDSDFVLLLERMGPPPKILWVTIGNCTNRQVIDAVTGSWKAAAEHFAAGDSLVEIGRRAGP